MLKSAAKQQIEKKYIYQINTLDLLYSLVKDNSQFHLKVLLYIYTCRHKLEQTQLTDKIFTDYHHFIFPDLNQSAPTVITPG